MQQEKLIIDETNFLGKGRHKATYMLPEASDKCVKIAYSDDGAVDLLREIDYRALRDKQGKCSRMLPEYYGKIITSLGDGFYFERVVDYDGKITATFQDYLWDEQLFEENLDMLVQVICDFKRLLMEERLLTMGIFPENILIQRLDEKTVFPRIINDMGCANLFRLEYYIDYFAKKKISRRWQRFYDYLGRKYKFPAINEFLKRVGREY